MRKHRLPNNRTDVLLQLLHEAVTSSDLHLPTNRITMGHRGDVVSIDCATDAFGRRIGGPLTNVICLMSMDLNNDLLRNRTGDLPEGVLVFTANCLPVTILMTSQNNGLVGVLVSVLEF